MVDVNVSRKVATHLKEITKNRMVIMRLGEEGALSQRKVLISLTGFFYRIILQDILNLFFSI